jgi:hypothetical protein
MRLFIKHNGYGGVCRSGVLPCLPPKPLKTLMRNVARPLLRRHGPFNLC